MNNNNNQQFPVPYSRQFTYNGSTDLSTYCLTVRQQPRKARLCSFKDKVDRRPLDPPPIVQLYQRNTMTFNDYHNSANFFLHCTLVNPNDQSDIHCANGNRTTAGSVVQSLHKLKDTNNAEGAFFIFADISIRIEGIFKLKFTLFQIKGMEVERICSIYSDPFQVYSPKSFPGMSESTELTRSFSDQGVRIRIRKEARAAAATTPSMKRRRGMDRQQEQQQRRQSPTKEDSPGSSSCSSSTITSSAANNVMSMQNLLISSTAAVTASESPPSSSRLLLSLPPPPLLHPMEPSFTSSSSNDNYYYTTTAASTTSPILDQPPLLQSLPSILAAAAATRRSSNTSNASSATASIYYQPIYYHHHSDGGGGYNSENRENPPPS